VNVNDPTGFDKQLPAEERRLEESDINERDKQSLKDWVVHRKANSDNKSHTLASHLNKIRQVSEQADTLLVEMDQLDWDRYVVEILGEERGLTDMSIDVYKSAARKYFRWLGHDWYENIEFTGYSDDDGPDPEDLFSMEEINAILQQGDSRGKALAACYADTGWRATLLASSTVGGADLEGSTAVLAVNEEAHRKGAEGNSPLSFSRAYLANYLAGDHPCPDDPEAPLFHKKQHYEDGDRAVGTNRIRTIIKDMAEAAGIDRDRANLHNFRHSAITRWRAQGIPDHRIEKRVKWVEGSDMFRVYDNPEEEDSTKQQAIAFGAADPEDFDDVGIDREAGDELTDCPVCGADVLVGARYCQICGNPMNVEAAMNTSPEDVQEPEETAEDLVDIHGVLDEMGTASVIEWIVKENPEILDRLDLD